jgi:hypothetical protein
MLAFFCVDQKPTVRPLSLGSVTWVCAGGYGVAISFRYSAAVSAAGATPT